MHIREDDPHQLLHLVLNHYQIRQLIRLLQREEVNLPDGPLLQMWHLLEHLLSHLLLGNNSKSHQVFSLRSGSGSGRNPKARAAAGQEMPPASSTTFWLWRARMSAWQ
jgi:hypothetical protein